MKNTTRAKFVYSYIVVALVVISLVVAFFLDKWWVERFQQQRFSMVESELEEVRDQLNLNLQRYLRTASGLPSLFVLNPEITQHQFGMAVKHLVSAESSIKNIAIAPDLVIKYVYPVKANQSALGFDYRTSPEQLETVQKAISLQKPVLAGPLNLVQGGQGLIVRLPMFYLKQGFLKQLMGVVAVVIDIDAFYKESGLIDEHSVLKIAIKGRDGLADQGQVFFGDERLFDNAKLIKRLSLPEGGWVLTAEPVEGWDVLPPELQTQRVIMASVVALCLLLFLVPVRLLYKNQLSNFKFRKLIDESAIPYVLLNAKNQATYVNTSFRESFGYSLEQLNTMTHWHDITDMPEQLRRFINTATNASKTEAQQLEITLRTAADEFKIVLINVANLSADNFDEKIVSVFDITDRKRVEQKLLLSNKSLAESEAHLKTVLTVLPDLIWFKDPNGAYLSSNAGFEEFIGAKEHDIIGKKDNELSNPALTHFLNVIDETTSINDSPRTNEEVTYVLNGEVITLEITKTPVIAENAQHLGILYVAQNITQRKKHEQSLLLASQVFENLREAVTVTDKEGIIVDINPAFSSITGYEKSEVVGKNMSILSSHQHDDSFYQAMWLQIEEHGFWQGEIFNKRKNGEVYPQLLRINAIYDETNDISLYIGLFHDVMKEHEAREQIWRQANYDSLTELPNRQFLIDHLDRELTKARRHQFLVATLFLDLDGFKDVNDSYGHDIGDQLLKDTAVRLSNLVREEDVVARQGGDEFIIVLSDLPDRSAAIRVAEKIIDVLSQPTTIQSYQIHISASLGISFYPDDALTTTELLKTSDQAMYEAKEAGKKRYSCFTPSMQERVDRRVQLINELHTANEKNQFELYFQPIVCLSDSTIYKAEALIRWNHPEKGLVSPADFIPIAEETKQINKIGHYVFEQSCEAVSLLKAKFGEDFQISFNLSPVQLSSNEYNPVNWIDALQTVDISASNLVIEITEGSFLQKDNHVLSLFHAFRDAGIQVALDDFGTGYSSLAYLQEYDIDYVKIDRVFVNRLSQSSDSFTLCEAIIVMAHKLGMKVVAEGVETEEQRQALAKMGCDFAQGYLFSKPIALADFQQLPTTFASE